MRTHLIKIVTIIIFIILFTIGLSINNSIKATTLSDLKAGDYVYYNTGVLNTGTVVCRVLYEQDSEYGLQIVSNNIVTNITLGNENDLEEAKDSYNNTISILNSSCQPYLNPTYTIDYRSIGSNPTIDGSGMFISKDSESGIWTPTSFTNDNTAGWKDTDTNYITDFNQLGTFEGKTSNKDYWLASRNIDTDDSSYYFRIYRVKTNTDLSHGILCQIGDSGDSTGNIALLERTNGLRPVFSVKPNVEIISGDGSIDNPYVLGTIHYKVEHYLQNDDLNGYTLHETVDKLGQEGAIAIAAQNQYDGFIFSAENSNNVISNTLTNENETILKVYYDRDDYNIILNTNEGTINEGNVTKYKYGIGATLPTDVTRSGFNFAGWYEAEDFSGEAVESIGIAELGEKTFYAKWIPRTYTITLNPNEGIINENYSTSYTHTVGTSLPTNITKRGYDFKGWYEDEDFSGDVIQTIRPIDLGNKVLYAKWEATIYTITYNLQGGIQTQPKTEYTIEDEDFTLERPERIGYTFKGWTGSNGDEEELDITIKTGTIGDKEYTANWIVNVYNITLNTSGGTINEGYETNYTYTIGANLPTNVTRDGFIFQGWYETEDFSGEAITRITEEDYGDKVFYSKWLDINPPEIIRVISNTNTWDNKEVILTGEAIDIQTGISYYQFSTDSDLTKDSEGWIEIENTKEEISQSYSTSENGIYYFYVKDKDGNISKKSIEITHIDMVKPTIREITVKDIDFYNISIEVSAEDRESNLANIFIFYKRQQDKNYLYKRLTLWTTSVIEGRIITEGKEETVDLMELIDLDNNTPYDVYVQVNDLAGNRTESEVMTISTARVKATIGTTEYASLQKAIDAASDSEQTTIVVRENVNENVIINKDIILDLNGCTISSIDSNLPTITVEENKRLDIKGNGQIKSKEGIAIDNKGITNLQEEVEVIGRTRGIYVAITFNSSEGSEIKPIEIDYNTSISDLPIPTKENFMFLGWYKEKAYETKIDSETKFKKNITLYAKWKEKDPITTEVYEIDEDNYITKVLPDTNVNTFLEGITTNGQVKIYDLYNNEISGEDLVGTGYKLEITFNDKVYNYEIVVIADLNGDGKLTVTDLSIMNQHLVNKLTLEGARLKAADLSEDGKTTITDLSIMNQALVGKITL